MRTFQITTNFKSLLTDFLHYISCFKTNYCENIKQKNFTLTVQDLSYGLRYPCIDRNFSRKEPNKWVLRYLNFCHRLCNLKEELVLYVNDMVVVYFGLLLA